MNCDIDKLATERLVASTVDDKLINGLRIPDGPDGKPAHGENLGKYATFYSSGIDLVHSFENPFKLFPRLGRTILKTISYIYSGAAPFIDLNTVFKIPCKDVDHNFLKGKKYDFGKHGRYGQPMSPFGYFALITPELQSDKKMKKGKCVKTDPTIPCEDLEDETT